MQQLSQQMTAQEFGLHLSLEQSEPLPHAQWSAVSTLLASLANGPRKPPEAGRLWRAADFMPGELWPDPDAPPPADKPAAKALTVAQIMARAKLAGM